MSVYVLMTKLAADAMHDSRGRRAMGKEWLQRVREACPEVKWIGHYTLLGPWDFMDIYEAPDVETAHKVSLISRSGGAVVAESWPAMHYDEYLETLQEVESD